MVGETDYPCWTSERPGVGRSYVQLDDRPVDDLGYQAWIRGVKEGRLYCGDGRSHFLEFEVNGHSSGGDDVQLVTHDTILIKALVAARLEPDLSLESQTSKRTPPYGWDLEWARIGTTRNVTVELVVDGIAVDEASLIADGAPRSIEFRRLIDRSAWVALRILPSPYSPGICTSQRQLYTGLKI